MNTKQTRRLYSVLGLAPALTLSLSQSACAPSHEIENEYVVAGDPMPWDRDMGFPLYFTVAFDGSKRFSMWIETMALARELEASLEAQGSLATRPSFTYFVNSQYYEDDDCKGPECRTIEGDDGIQRIRWALTQQAINEGHEIASRGIDNQLGHGTTVEEWAAEFDQFDEHMAERFYKPVRLKTASGAPPEWAFPRWELSTELQDCSILGEGEACVMLNPSTPLRTRACTTHDDCTSDGMLCDGPANHASTGICLPEPVRAPVVHLEQIEAESIGDVVLLGALAKFQVDEIRLFDDSGRPKLEEFGPEGIFAIQDNGVRSLLSPYQVQGHRAARLEFSSNSLRELLPRGYTYSASYGTMALSAPRIYDVDDSGTMVVFPTQKAKSATRMAHSDQYWISSTHLPGELVAEYRAALLENLDGARVPFNINQRFDVPPARVRDELIAKGVSPTESGAPGDWSPYWDATAEFLRWSISDDCRVASTGELCRDAMQLESFDNVFGAIFGFDTNGVL